MDDTTNETLKAWRRHLHAHPELGYEEKATSDFVAQKLASFGLSVHRGLGGTGVVGTLSRGEGRAIALRADMDALPIEEMTNLEYRSKTSGVMHACGHDGHMTMLLGAAQALAASDKVTGTVHFVFQPAEETGGGGRKMVEDGLFKEFPVDAVYGAHNWPGLPFGAVAVRPGPVMAASDMFEITIEGKGMHAGMPNLGVDAIVIAGEILGALQLIASRNTHPADASTVSVTQIHAGDSWNAVPQTVVLRGTARSFRAETRKMIEARMKQIANGIAAAHGARAEVDFRRGYPATVNDAEAAAFVTGVAMEEVGADKVLTGELPSMGTEDFAYMLEAEKGCYFWLGAGPAEHGHILHNAGYDFNDDLIPVGVDFWVKLAEASFAR
ncbi:M20 aminoacylase family protein [Acuticoccus kandeliae]|uniref:M20 aminoacylase family protein n=1 Tax=Acuticoccus kandeliae TaxID=2073160 RepID=UPI000D3E1F55|nr:M20 aminoacylase family protein [Acuticoccus kandeliae]